MEQHSEIQSQNQTQDQHHALNHPVDQMQPQQLPQQVPQQIVQHPGLINNHNQEPTVNQAIHIQGAQSSEPMHLGSQGQPSESTESQHVEQQHTEQDYSTNPQEVQQATPTGVEQQPVGTEQEEEDSKNNIPNPWEVNSFKEFCYYCCPECDFKTKTESPFQAHAEENHPKVI